MLNARPTVPTPVNEPIFGYKPGSPERAELKAKLAEMMANEIEIPIILGGEEIKTGRMGECRPPHDHKHLLGKYHIAGKDEVKKAIETALAAREKWAATAWEDRAAIFLKAAYRLKTSWRATINAATMLAQSKNAYQAEIDAACELIDFWNFNAKYAEEIYGQQPLSVPGIWNYVEQRALEGFVFAVTPFNFTSIAGNLPSAPALMGNVVVWKPASTAVFSAYYLMKLLEECGLPKGVINMVPGPGSELGDVILSHKDLAGVHFTGSTQVFRHMWKTIGNNIDKYRSYPRIVGETGGKDFVMAHESADVDALATNLVLGAFQYQGQKCSAASRAYIPDNIWPAVKAKLVEVTAGLKVGDVTDFTNFMGAVIDKTSFDKIKGYIDYAKAAKDAEIIVGGECDDSKGWFIRPTVILTTNPHFKTMEEEIFAPVLTVYVYPAAEFEETMDLLDETSPYALTGAVFANDKAAATRAFERLRNCAGNFYLNDKPTGAVVGQQPFGGARASGTNDKAGAVLNLLRWVSPRAIKENFAPLKDHLLPFMAEK